MKRILIIEDNELLGDLLLKSLKANDFECNLIRDGAKGYDAISEWKPDLIVLDLFMPIMNGFDILRQKKADDKISSIPVIVLTNSLGPTSSVSMENLGATDFMVKSDVTQKEVIDRIKKIFNNN